MPKIITKSEKETFNLGKKLTKDFKGGEVISLNGELGAGKTILVKGVAQGLGIKEVVNSPTFLLMKIYPAGAKKLVHIDCYRINKAEEVTAIGATEYFGQPDTITIIEWGDKIKKILPKSRINVNIKVLKNYSREITINQNDT